MSTVDTQLTGLQKAGVLMLSLGAEASAKVFDQLTPGEREMLGAEIVKLRHVDSYVKHEVVEEVNHLLRESISRRKKRISLVSEPGPPLKWIEDFEADDVVQMLSRERAQSVALVLAHLNPKAAADVLSRLDENLRNDVAYRLATMRPVAKEVVDAVDAAMRERAFGIRPDKLQTGGSLMGILNSATERVRESVIGALTHAEPSVEMSRRNSINSLEDMALLSDAQIKKIVSRVDRNDLCLAIRVGSDEMRSAILRNMPDDAAYELRRDLAATSQARVRDIEEAQSRIMHLMKSLAGDPAAEARIE